MSSRRSRRKDGARQHAHGVCIYGWHSAVAALRNPARHVHKVLATANAVRRLLELGLPAPAQPSDPHELDLAAGQDAVHQGIAVLCDPLPGIDLEDLGGAALLVVLDQVTDPHNVGAILRSAAAFGAAGLVMTERHGPADSGVLAKAASGAMEHVPIVRVKNLARALVTLGAMDFTRLGLDSEGAERLAPELAAGARVALVLGSEGTGLRRLTREHCDRVCRLVLPGPIQSLNVSNAAAVALQVIAKAP